MNVLLVGEESAGIQTLKALARSDHRIVAVMASPAKKLLSSSTLWQVAERIGLPTWPASFVKDPAFVGRIRDAGIDIILNVHSLFVMHGEVVEAPRIGSFNLHPGPLPRYAGLNVVSWAIYRGEQTHGVTVPIAMGISTRQTRRTGDWRGQSPSDRRIVQYGAGDDRATFREFGSGRLRR